MDEGDKGSLHDQDRTRDDGGDQFGLSNWRPDAAVARRFHSLSSFSALVTPVGLGASNADAC